MGLIRFRFTRHRRHDDCCQGIGGESVAGQLAHVFANLTTASTFPVVIGVY